MIPGHSRDVRVSFLWQSRSPQFFRWKSKSYSVKDPMLTLSPRSGRGWMLVGQLPCVSRIYPLYRGNAAQNPCYRSRAQVKVPRQLVLCRVVSLAILARNTMLAGKHLIIEQANRTGYAFRLRKKALRLYIHISTTMTAYLC